MTDKIRILVVDDDPQFRQLLRAVLRRVGDFEFVSEAGDGKAAVDRTREHQPDVVLLDLLMPGMDGFEALPLIKDAHPDTDVLVLTALDEEEAQEAALVGASGFIEKRHITERLEAAIRRCRPTATSS